MEDIQKGDLVSDGDTADTNPLVNSAQLILNESETTHVSFEIDVLMLHCLYTHSVSADQG